MIKVLKKMDFTSENKYLHHPSSHLPLPSKTPIPSTFPPTRPSNPVWAADFRYTSQDRFPMQSEPLTGFLIKLNFRLSRLIKAPAHSYTQYYCCHHITVAPWLILPHSKKVVCWSSHGPQVGMCVSGFLHHQKSNQINL